jgi:hypothetical protein
MRRFSPSVVKKKKKKKKTDQMSWENASGLKYADTWQPPFFAASVM